MRRSFWISWKNLATFLYFFSLTIALWILARCSANLASFTSIFCRPFFSFRPSLVSTICAPRLLGESRNSKTGSNAPSSYLKFMYLSKINSLPQMCSKLRSDLFRIHLLYTASKAYVSDNISLPATTDPTLSFLSGASSMPRIKNNRGTAELVCNRCE